MLRSLAVLAAVGLLASTARAAPTDVELRAARQLFLDAEKDEDAGRWADALEKLRRVAEVKPTPGVRSHAALCEEHLGQLARALDDYTAAQTQASADGATDVLRFVAKRLAGLGPRVPRLTVQLVPAVPDAVVTLDGTGLGPSVLGVPIPVDPGEHAIEATSTGRLPVRRTIAIRERDTTVVELELSEPPAPPPAPASAQLPGRSPTTLVLSDRFAPEASPAPSRLAASLSTAGAVALAGGGVAAYVLAGSARSSAIAQCARIVSDSPDACDAPRNGVRAWDATAALAWLGAAGVGALAVVLWAQPGEASVAARALLGPGGVVVGGRF